MRNNITGNPSPWMYYVSKATTGLWLRLFGVRFVGDKNLPKSGPAIIAANHIHSLDPFAIGQSFRRPLYFMTKKELFVNPISKWFFRSGNGFSVDRQKADLSAIKTSLRILAAGEFLVIFPSGHRGANDSRGGAGYLANKAHVPVIPVGIAQHGRRFTLIFGDPISPLATADATTHRVQEAMDALRVQAESN